jgi:CheY-like chemotaxis protein
MTPVRGERAAPQSSRSQLAGLDVDVFSAADGVAGLADAPRWGPSAILLDLDRPDMGGFEVCRRVKSARVRPA